MEVSVAEYGCEAVHGLAAQHDEKLGGITACDAVVNVLNPFAERKASIGGCG
jgi:hypothetical protein